MLNTLGGRHGKISLLQLDILNWDHTSRSVVQNIAEGIANRQPFQQIVVQYQCNSRHSMERLVIAKYLAMQEHSSCPTQIRFANDASLLGYGDSDRAVPVRTQAKPHLSDDSDPVDDIKDYSDHRKHQAQRQTLGQGSIIQVGDRQRGCTPLDYF